MKIVVSGILAFLFLFVSCSENGKEKKAEPPSGPHSEIYIQYHSQESYKTLQPYEMEANESLNEHLSSLLRSDLLIAKALIKTGGKSNEGIIRETKEKLTFKGVENTQMLLINFYHSDENFANSFLKNLVEALNEDLMQSIIDKSNKELMKINETLDSLAVDRNEYETELMENPGMEDEELQEIRNYFDEYMELEKRKKVIVTVKTGLENQVFLDLSSVMPIMDETDAFLKKALEEIDELQKSKNRLQCPKPGNAECEKIDARIEILYKDVFTYLQNSIKALDAKMGMLQAEIKKIPQKNPNAAKQNNNRILKLEVDEKLYNFLVEKKASLTIERAGFTPPIRILDGPKYKRK